MTDRLWMLLSVLILAAIIIVGGGALFYAPSLLAPLGVLALIIFIAVGGCRG